MTGSEERDAVLLGEEDRARVHHGGGFTCGSGEREDGTREDAGERVRQDHLHDRLEARGAQGERGFAPVLRDLLEGRFRRIDDDRQAQHGKREDAGEKAHAEAAEDHEERQAEEAEYDRRNTREVRDREADHGDDGRVEVVLVEEHGAHDAERQRDHEGACGEEERAHDAGPDAAFAHHVARGFGEELPGHGGHGVPEDDAEHRDEREHAHEGRRRASP